MSSVLVSRKSSAKKGTEARNRLGNEALKNIFQAWNSSQVILKWEIELLTRFFLKLLKNDGQKEVS